MTYAKAIFHHRKDIKTKNEAKSTKGEDIKKLNVIPIGNPALVNPINIGILEHEQNGVSVPSKAPKIFPLTPLYFRNITVVLSGGKKL